MNLTDIRDELSPARREVILAIKLRPEAPVEELAGHLSLSVSTLRSHLLSLEAAGFIAHRSSGHGPGRRRHYYHLTRRGERLFPRHFGGLSLELAHVLLKVAPTEMDAFVDRWLARAVQSVEQAGPRTESRLEAIGQRFEEGGFMPSHGRDGDTRTLTLSHCPFIDLATAWDGICRSEVRFLEQTLPGANAELVRHRLRGDRVCELRVRLAEAHARVEPRHPRLALAPGSAAS